MGYKYHSKDAVFGSWPVQDNYAAAALANYSSELFSSIFLRLVRDPILLINKQVSGGGDENQSQGKYRNGTCPSRYIALGIIFLGSWVSWRSIYHFIYILVMAMPPR